MYNILIGGITTSIEEKEDIRKQFMDIANSQADALIMAISQIDTYLSGVSAEQRKLVISNIIKISCAAVSNSMTEATKHMTDKDLINKVLTEVKNVG